MRRIALTILLCLAACAPRTEYELIPPASPEAQACVDKCMEVKHNCTSHCQSQQKQCTKKSEANAESAYTSYDDLQERLGMPSNKSQSDFYAGSRCSAQACESDCDGAWRACYSQCGGKVIPHTSCTGICY